MNWCLNSNQRNAFFLDTNEVRNHEHFFSSFMNPQTFFVNMRFFKCISIFMNFWTVMNNSLFLFFWKNSATIENGTLISHDIHNLAVIKSDQIQQQQQQQPQQTGPLVVTTSAATNAINNGTTTASHSGSSGRSTPNNTDSAPGKLFVGGLSWQTSAEKLKEYFGMFGSVTDVLIMKDPVTQVSNTVLIF